MFQKSKPSNARIDAAGSIGRSTQLLSKKENGRNIAQHALTIFVIEGRQAGADAFKDTLEAEGWRPVLEGAAHKNPPPGRRLWPPRPSGVRGRGGPLIPLSSLRNSQ